jgi:RNA polymerase sigma-70 factor (ECF subfamily)
MSGSTSIATGLYPYCGPEKGPQFFFLKKSLAKMSREAHLQNDARIIGEVLAGNLDAFELLLSRYQEQVAQIVRKHVPRQNVPEVAHDTFIQAYQSLPSFKGTKPFKHWLAKIAIRRCHDFWREYYQRREVPVSAISAECRFWLEHLLSDQSQEEAKERLEARDLLNWALGQLSAAERMVLTLTYLDEYSLAEAAALLGWSIPRVKIQSYRARHKLRKILVKILPRG